AKNPEAEEFKDQILHSVQDDITSLPIRCPFATLRALAQDDITFSLSHSFTFSLFPPITYLLSPITYIIFLFQRSSKVNKN
ncbi:MAG: hypothetical protein ACK4WJ_05850, partial [Endomicrobiia bacterium]